MTTSEEARKAWQEVWVPVTSRPALRPTQESPTQACCV